MLGVRLDVDAVEYACPSCHIYCNIVFSAIPDPRTLNI